MDPVNDGICTGFAWVGAWTIEPDSDGICIIAGAAGNPINDGIVTIGFPGADASLTASIAAW
jgi:hypothetical protein